MIDLVRAWAVIVIDNFDSYEREENYQISGFPDSESAVEYARRFIRHCIEEIRWKHGDEELRELWLGLGLFAIVSGPDGFPDYTFEDELESFFNNPASPEECDYKAIARLAGVDENIEF